MNRCIALLMMIVMLLSGRSLATPHKITHKQLSRSHVPVQLQVPFVPPAFRANGRLGLAYELHLAGFRNIKLRMVRIDVFSVEHMNHSLLTLTGEDLSECLLRPGRPSEEKSHEVLAGGQFTVVCLWIMMDPGQSLPSAIAHRATFQRVSDDDNKHEYSVEGAVINPRMSILAPLHPPLPRGRWLMANGPWRLSDHRLVLHCLDGRASNTQRLASDWILMGSDGRLAKDHRRDNVNWYSYGIPILAVADSKVVDMVDGIPDNIPLSNKRSAPTNRETAGGNYVVLKLSESCFAFYGHLQPGSIRVQKGDHVRVGQELARIGNSGNSDAPHLHFHVANTSDPLSGEGVPFAFTSFVILDKFDDASSWEHILEKNIPWKQEPGMESKLRQNEMPLGEAIIEFQ